MSLKVLITSTKLTARSGTTVYVLDLALELRRQGHRPFVHTFFMGEVADELRSAGIPVSTTLRGIGPAPDIIHGHHYYATLNAIQRLRAVPAIYICHDHVCPFDRAPQHPLIHRYFGVSQVCMDRLVRDGIPERKIAPLFNFVDTARFLPRQALPDRPRRALVFSNYARESSQLPAIREACKRTGLELEVIGAGAGRAEAFPERVIGQYDIVFAKAKCALEAMAVGAAVVLCDFAGAGPMVTSAELDRLRKLNFGFQALSNPLQPEYLVREIERYDRHDAAHVRDTLRAGANLHAATARLIEIYEEVIATEKTETRACMSIASRSIPTRRLQFMYVLLGIWLKIPPSWRSTLKQAAILRSVLATIRSTINAIVLREP